MNLAHLPCRRPWVVEFVLSLALLQVLALGEVRAATPVSWRAESIRPNPGPDNGSVFQNPEALAVDGQGRLYLAWTESSRSGAPGSGWWARRDSGEWSIRSITNSTFSPEFSLFSPRGAASLALSSNGVPHFFHASANFAAQEPYFVSRIDLEVSPSGPGVFSVALPGSASVRSTFDTDGRASHPPDIVWGVSGFPLRGNGVQFTSGDVAFGDAAEVVFRQGPKRQLHVLYQTADGQLRYNGGGPTTDRAILPGNTGSSAYALAIDESNGIHVSAARGTGRFFFGAVGQLAYLHSPDGQYWETNLIAGVPEDVGATAIALDSAQRPAIAFTRAFGALFFTRFDGKAWSTPALLRTGLGGWDFSRGLRLAFDSRDRPHILVADRLTRRLLLLSGSDEALPADLAVSSIVGTTNRVAVRSNVTVTVTITNAGPANAASGRLQLRLPDEWVVRDLNPRPTEAVGSNYRFDLGIVHALESRTFTFTLTALDPALGQVEAALASDTEDADLSNNVSGMAAPVAFLSAECLANPKGPGCDVPTLVPAAATPALAGQPWSLVFRAPAAPIGSEIRLSPSRPLPPEFCLTAEGELRGIMGGAGAMPLAFDLVEPGGRTTTFARDVPVFESLPADGPDAFWPLDGNGLDSIGGVPATIGARGAFLAGVVGQGLQSAGDVLLPTQGTSEPAAPLFASSSLFGGAAFGQAPVTVTAWIRQDGGAKVRGDGRRFGLVLGLLDPQSFGRPRSVAFDPATSRLNLLAGPPDFRATVLTGPVLPANAWIHLAWVSDGLNVRLYTNGVLAVSGRFPEPLPDRPTLQAGGWANGGEFSGALDEIAVYRRALAPAEIAGLTSRPLPRRTPLPPGGTFPIAAILRELDLPDAPQGEPYQATLVHAFCGTPKDLRLVQGTLPNGLSLSNDGEIRGVSTTAGVSRFRVRASDAGGAFAELAVRITTRPGLPAFTRHPVDQQVEAGALLVLYAETRGESELQWYFDDRPLAAATSDVLAIPDFSNAQVGRYRVRASNATGSTWSREVRVSLRTEPEKPPTVDVAPVVVRPDGWVRVRVATLRGRVYELQRALDLGAALAGGWRTVSRFVADGAVGDVDDILPGRPDAAFYRVVEIVPPPASAYSFEDAGRLVGLGADGQARPGLLPSVDAVTGRLGPFEYRVAGEELGIHEGLVVRLPGGAQPIDREGARAFAFRQAEVFFGEESPVQLDEGGMNRVVLNSASDVEIPSGPMSVEVLERLLGKPRGSGVGLTFFRHFRFKLLSGILDGNRIRNAELAWADRAAGRVPTPERTGSGIEFDIELTATRLRLPFHGEFVLEDGSPSAARIAVSPNRPIWVELRPGPELALSGRGTLSFAGGPEFDIDFTFDDPVFRAAIGAKKLRLPEGLTLRSFLGRIPLPTPPGPPPASGVAERSFLPDAPEASTERRPTTHATATATADYLKAVKGKAIEAARKSCATSATALELLGVAPPRPGDLQDPGVDANDDELAASNFTERALAELRAWSCVAEAYGGADRVPEPAYLLKLVERHVSTAVADALPGAGRTVELGAMTYAYRAAVLAEVAHMATLYPPEMADPNFTYLAVTDPRFAGSLNPPNPRMQPYVDWAFEGFEALRESDPTTFDTTTLIVAAKSIAKVIAAANRNSTVIAPERATAMQSTFEVLVRARAAAMQRELSVQPGRFTPEGNPRISALHRWEAMAYLRQALRINEAAMLSGAGTTDPVAPEVLSQLSSQAWADLRNRITAVTNQCTAPAYAIVLGAAAEIASIARVGDQLEAVQGVTSSLPTSADIQHYTFAMERACAEAHPPVTFTDLYVRASPARADEGRVLAFEGRLALLTQIPKTIRTATPEILDALSYSKQAFDPIFFPTSLPPIEAFKPGLLLRTLRAGMMQDNLRRRFRLTADPDWLQIQLPALQRVMRRKLKGENLATANRLLQLAAWRPKANPVTLARGGAAPALARTPAAVPDEGDDAPDDLERRHAYLLAALDGVAAEEEAALALGDEVGIDQPASDVIDHLADLRLPGGLTVEAVAGELVYHAGRRELGGRFRGELQVPGAGLRLSLNRADFSTGGSFSGELFGSLSLPPNRPVATLSIPSSQPARLAWVRGGKPTLSGGGRLALSDGAVFDCFLALEDPVYRFAASARGLRFQFNRAAVEQIGVPFADALNEASTGRAIQYLERAGLMVEGVQPPRDEPPSFRSSRGTEVRPQPSDTDDVAAGAAALWLLTRTDTLNVPPVANAAEPGTLSSEGRTRPSVPLQPLQSTLLEGAAPSAPAEGRARQSVPLQPLRPTLLEGAAPSASAEGRARQSVPLQPLQPTLLEGAAPSAPAAGVTLPPAALASGTNLVRLLTEQLGRANATMSSDVAALTLGAEAIALDAAPVPVSEGGSLRRAKVLEVARRLGEIGRHFGEIVTQLGTERGRQILGASTSKTDWEDGMTVYVRAFRDALVAARDRVLIPVAAPTPGRGPWAPGEDWDRVAATHLLVAAQNYEATVQGLGITEATLVQAGAEVGCAVLGVVVEERLAGLGIDPGTGALPSSGGALVTYLGLSRDEARSGLADLLHYESLNQAWPVCGGELSPRLGRGIAGMVLRSRDLAAQEWLEGLARVRANARRPWEEAEFVQGAGSRLVEIFDLPARLGLERYPEPTFALRPMSANEEVQDVRRDVADLFGLLETAWSQLANLAADETSGYPAELRRRKAVPLPAAGPLARLLAKYSDLPAVTAVKGPLSRLAIVEAQLLDVQTAEPGFPARLGRDASGWVARVLNAARILETAPASGSSGLASVDGGRPQDRARVAAVQTLTGSVLARIESAVSEQADLPWWVSTTVARSLDEASRQSWTDPATIARLRTRAVSTYRTGRQRVWAMVGTRVAPPESDLSLPGEVEVTHVFGSLVLNRETHYVLFEIGGRLDFPNVRTADGRTAFLALDRLRLESTGQFAFAAATRVPLPFEGASFAGSFRASGDLPRRALSLAGEGTLTFVNAPPNPETGQPFPPQLSAAASYEPIGYDSLGRPVGWRFTIGASGAFRRSFGKDFALFGAGAGLIAGVSAEGNPIGGVTVGGSVGLFRKSDRRAIEPPAPSDFHVLVENAGVEIVGTVDESGYAAVTNGTARLPDFFFPVDLPAELACANPGMPRIGTSVAIRDPIRVRYAAGEKPRLEGALRFSHFGVRLGGTNAVSNSGAPQAGAAYAALTVCQADVGIDADGFPFLDIPRAGLGFNIPSWDRGLIRLENLHLGFDGRTRGELFLVEDFDLIRAGGLRISLLGAPSYADPAVRPPVGCRGTSIVLEDVPDFPQPRITLSGGVRALFPVDFLANTDGSQAGGFFCGGIRVEPTADGPAVSAFVDELGFTGNFKMGRTGFELRDARIGSGNFGGILNPDQAAPFFLSVSGDLKAGPFVFGLNNAQVRYRGPELPPAFALEAVRFSRDATASLPAPFSLLPGTVDFAELRFRQPSAPIDEMFAPENVQITASFRVGLPTVEKAFLAGGASGLVFRFREDGTLIPPPIDGFDLTLSNTGDLQLPALGNLSGKIRIGGLRRAVDDQGNLHPDQIYAVGQISATQQGYRMAMLSAFNLIGPIGFCLDLNFGGAGIVLAPTPFQITGAFGGIALLSTEDPCDFTKYFEFDTTTGTYQLRQTVELPSIPIGMTWAQFTRTLEQMAARIDGFASRFPQAGEAPASAGSLPIGVGGEAALTPALSLRMEEAGPATATSREPSVAVLAEAAGESPGSALPGSSFAPGTFSAFQCPEECPPRTVAILCQPHPDTNRFPHRVIFKFSSITESMLTNAPPSGLGLDVAAIRGLGTDASRIGGEVARRLVTSLSRASSGVGSLPPTVQAFLRQQEDLALEGVQIATSNAVAAVVRRSPDAYTAIRDELYRGAGCPDISLALGGRMSMVGLSAFGWIEGLETTSFSGSGGVIGRLYALGVPMGDARVFVSTTDAQGLPNPSACGQVTASFGPLELGQVDLALRCENCVTELLGLLPRIVRAVGPTFLRRAVDRVAPELASVAADPEAFLARWQLASEADRSRIAFGLLTQLTTAEPGWLPGNLGDSLRTAFADTWDRINPQLVLCGDATPRLMGLPLTLGGRSLALNFLGEKSRVIGEFAFSPNGILPLFPPGDEASMSFAYRIADPVSLLLRSLDGTLTRPETREAFIREQTQDVLQNMVLAANYQWHPFGLELSDAAVRFVMPDLLDHPALPGSSWVNPDTLANAGVPTRDEVLVQAAASGKLGRAFDWLGTTNDLADIFPAADPRRAVLGDRRMDLRRDYFPHGGFLGGARMALPRMLVAAPSEWRPLYDRAVHGTNLFEQLDAAMTLLNEFVLRTETNGTAAFYTPAPNPPLLYAADGRALSAAEVRNVILRRPDDFSPEGLVRQWQSLGAGTPETMAHLYADDISFLRAEMTNLTLLGMPVFGTARMTGKPTPVRWVDGQPLARLEVDIAGDSPVGKVAGGDFAFGFDLYATPQQSLAVWATEWIAELRRQRAGGSPAALASVPAGGRERRASLDTFAGELARQLPRFAATNTLPSLSIVDLRNWAAGSGPVVLPGEEIGGGFGGSSGRGGRFGTGSAPPATPPVLRADLSLYAFSPFYEPAAAGEGPVVESRRHGGLAARGVLEILPESPSRSGSAQAELAVTVTGNQPRLAGRLTALTLPTPFPGLSLQNARADFDSQAATFLRAFTTVPDLTLGTLFQLRSAVANQSLSVSVALSQSLPSSSGGGPGGQASAFVQSYASRLSLELPPARLTSDLVSGALQLHGAGHLTNPVVLGEAGWSARASFVSPGSEPTSAGSGFAGVSATTGSAAGSALTLRATLGGERRDVVRVSGLPTAAFQVNGSGADSFVARFDGTLPGSLTVELFPDLTIAGLPSRVLQVGAAAEGGFQFEFHADGTFVLEGALSSGFDAGAPGLFGAGARVRVDDAGATISGNVGTSTGTLRVGLYDGRIEARFSGQLSFPPFSLLGGRVVLAAADGGNMTATSDAAGTCVSGAVLTLQDFGPAAPIRLILPRFCLGADGSFTDLQPVSGVGPALHQVGEPDLAVGAFVLENLRSLRLHGDFTPPSLRLDYDADLKLGTLLDVAVRGSVGSAGLSFVQNVASTRLLGFDFSGLRLGATNIQGELPDIGFVGRIATMPAPLSNVDMGGRIPGTGSFSLLPVNRVDLPALIPSFPLGQGLPAFQYRPDPYAAVIRANQPSGYWPFEETAGAVLDQRLAKFGTTQRRSGTAIGNVTRGEPGAFGDPAGLAARFDGGTAQVRLMHDALAPRPESFSVSLWFRRASSQVRAAPRTLAARGTQWTLALREPSSGDGTRVQFGLAGPTRPDGAGLGPLTGRTRVDDTLWHHLAAVYDGIAQFLYLDGRLEAWQPVRGSIASASNVPTTLGVRLVDENPVDAYNGWLDEVAVYPGALRPVDVFAQWLAAGRGGVSLGAQLGADTIPGLAARAVDGFVGPNGEAVVSFDSGGSAEWGGLRFPDFRATVFRVGGTGAATFEAGLRLPLLDAATLGTAQGVLDGNGTFAMHASALADRGVFGWNLRLTNLTASGNWIQRTASARVGGRLVLPYDIATLAVGGDLDTARGKFTLLGSAGGAFGFGSGLPFSYSAAPELSEQRFRLPGRLGLGHQPDAVSFGTEVNVTRTGDVSASFSGLTDWIGFEGIGFGRLGWAGNLGYVNGQPNLAFRGHLGLSTPQHPTNIEDLPEGPAALVSQKPRIAASLRNPDKPMNVSPQGRAIIQAEPPFQGRAFFEFELE